MDIFRNLFNNICSLVFIFTLCNEQVVAQQRNGAKQIKQTTSAHAIEKTDFLVTIETPLGKMKVILFDDTPLHKQNFVQWAEKGAYNGTIFHRVIAQFMNQGGMIDAIWAPKVIPAEIKSHHLHEYGALAAARTPDQVNPEKKSDGSQFYIVNKKEGTPFLNGQYTVFGKVISGFATIDAIAQTPKGAQDVPQTPVTMKISVERVPISKILAIQQFELLYGYPMPE